MSIIISDNTFFRGIFALVVRDINGRLIESYTDNNLIVDGARDAMARLVSQGGSIGDRVITKHGVGTGTSPATPSDKNLTNPHYVDVLSFSYPSSGAVTFTFKLGADDANGMAITEYGLTCTDGSLFARKIRSVITKQSDLIFEIAWTLKF